MHASSFENMSRCHARYVTPAMADRDTVSVVDVGGADVNGGYRRLFHGPRYDYQTVDLEEGDGVDIVLDDPYALPFDDHSIDVVLSGQMLEHCEFFWQTFAEMMRVLRKDGILVLIAPSGGPIHRYPVDCYRFYPDAYGALARYAGCHLLEVRHDERGPWRDLVGVFSWQPAWFTPRPAIMPPPDSSYDVAASPRGTDAEEATAGDQLYLDTLARLHEALRPELYLEIGIRHGRSLALAKGAAVGVDPAPEVIVELPQSARVVAETSDLFFEATAEEVLGRPVDLAFIDGMHLFEYVLRDFMHIERLAQPGTLVVVDDVLPVHPAQARRDRRTQTWTGDTWKLEAVLRKHRPDLTLLTLDTSPTGLLLIAGLNPANKVLWAAYNPIVREWSTDMELPAEVIARDRAEAPTGPVLGRLLEALTSLRQETVSPGRARQRLRSALGASA